MVTSGLGTSLMLGIIVGLSVTVGYQCGSTRAPAGPPAARDAPADPPRPSGAGRTRLPTVVAPPAAGPPSSSPPEGATPPTAVRDAPAPAPDVPPGRDARVQGARPSVDAILLADDRRLAVIDGQVVGVGDRAGGVTVDAIDGDTVTVRDDRGVIVVLDLRGTAAAPSPDDR